MKKSPVDIPQLTSTKSKKKKPYLPFYTFPKSKFKRSNSRTTLIKKPNSIKRSKSLGQVLTEDELNCVQKYIQIIAKDPIQTQWLGKLSKSQEKSKEKNLNKELSKSKENAKEKKLIKSQEIKKDFQGKEKSELASTVKDSYLLDKTDSRALTENLVTFDLGSKFTDSNTTDFILSRNQNILDKIKQNDIFLKSKADFQWNDALIVKKGENPNNLTSRQFFKKTRNGFPSLPN